VTSYGYSLSSEELSAPAMVRAAQAAESVGFGSVVLSDHFHPWIDEQGESPFVWSVVGGIGATTGLRVGTGVTCPTMRVHPAIIAQAAATFLGVGSGENLNEHILGDRWPAADERLDMLEDAVWLMRLLWEGGTTSYEGPHYVVDNARIYSLPETPPPIIVSGFGPKSTALAGRIGDGYITTSPDGDMVSTFRSNGGEGKPVLAMTKMCWHENADEARRLVHRLWPTHGLKGELSQELRTPAHFEQACELVDEERAVGSIPVGPDPGPYISVLQEYEKAGFTEVFVQQVGPNQEGFLRFWSDELAPRLGVAAESAA
jgi:G6PDH family F420-dependent oxidoreductase